MLVFLNSGILFLAIATVIPILIYLFIIKKPKKVVFSSIKFIKMSQKKQKSKIKLKNLLLLIIRCLIILLAIAAISRPAIRSSYLDRKGRHSQVALAIILDTSYSMDYLVDTRTELEIGKEIISKISSKLNEDDVTILLTSDPTWNKINSVKHYGGIPEHLLPTIDITPLPTPIDDLIDIANQRLDESQVAHKEIHVITDFRAQEYPQDNENPILIIPTSDIQERNNISVQNSRIEAEYVEKKFERVVAFDIVNHSSSSMHDIICQLVIDGRTVSEKVTDIQPQQRKQESFTINITEPGWYNGYVSVRNERLPYDTRNYFTHYHPEDSQVAALTRNEALPLPLESLLHIYVGNSNNIHYLSSGEIDYEQLLGYDFVVIDSRISLSARVRFLLERLHKNGQGLLYILSEDIDSTWEDYYQEKFKINISYYHNDNPTLVSEINTYHPIMSIFRSDENESIEVNSFWQATIEPGYANTLLSTNLGPLAVEKDRAILWLFNIGEIRNRLVLDPLYPVMAYRTFLYSSYQETHKYRVGDRVILPQNEIIIPSGETITTNEKRYSLTDNGIYGIPMTSEYTRYLAVNLDYEPSDYNRLNDIDEPMVMTLDDSWQEQILINRYGYEVWRHILIIVIMLLISEMYIVKKQE